MSMFGDYKSYKKFTPMYPEWKNKRDLADAKRLAYLEKHPEAVNQEDIQRGKIVLRAIDIMDEYSQKKAENMEATTEPIIAIGLETTATAGALIGGLLGKVKPIGEFFARIASKGSKYTKLISIGVPTAIGLMLGSLAAFPLMAWGAKAEVGASRKGRFEAMRKELENPNGFAILTEQQEKEANYLAKTVTLEEDEKKSITTKLSGSFKSLKDMAVDSKEYKEQRVQFEKEIEEDEHNLNIELSNSEIENAKKDQQLLAKLIEKIDIASQDYAENSELATQAAIVLVDSLSGLIYFGVDKLLSKLNIKSGRAISYSAKGISFTAVVLMGILSAQINKQASRVGRFKAKQELLENPNNFVYVSDEQIKDIDISEVKQKKRPNLFAFLISAIKDNRKFEKYKKTDGKDERKFYKAAEKLELTPAQLKNAKRLQKNTFRTFNKVDENSQKFSESIEALGQAIAYPINMVITMIAGAFALPYLFKEAKTKAEMNNNFAKYLGIIVLSTVPAMIINTFITREQKRASRVADMKAIEELNDYRKFK